jgi:dolichol-phosphate mannosyltransferase
MFKSCQERFPSLFQVIRFAVVGTLSAVVDFGLYSLLRPHMEANSNYISVFIAMVVNFLINKYWTFSCFDHSRLLRQSAFFFLVSGFGYFLNQVIFFILLKHTEIGLLFSGHGDYAAKIIAILIVMFWNFFGNKHLTFRKTQV